MPATTPTASNGTAPKAPRTPRTPPDFAPPNQKVLMIGIDGDGSAPPAGAKKSTNAKAGSGAPSKAETMTAAKVASGMSAVFAVMAITNKNGRYVLTEDEKKAFQPQFAEIADGVNALPDWLKAAVTRSSAGAGAGAAIAFVMLAKIERANAPDEAEFQHI